MTLLKYSPLAIERRQGGKPKYAERIDQCRAWLDRRGPEGVGSWEILALGWTNPSQMHKDLVKAGFPISRVSERPPKPTSPTQRGVRFFHAAHAPAGATPVLARKAPRVREQPSAAPEPKASSSAGPVGQTRTRRPRATKPDPTADMVSIFEVLGDVDPIHDAPKDLAA